MLDLAGNPEDRLSYSIEIWKFSVDIAITFVILGTTVKCEIYFLIFFVFNLSHVLRKPVFLVSDLVRHKPGFAVIEDGKRLEISDLERRGIVLSM